MTDRFHSFTVVLDRDYRDDDAEEIMQAIRMLKYVISVKGNVSDLSTTVAQQRMQADFVADLMKFARNWKPSS